MRTHIALGPVPLEEPCAQTVDSDYALRARAECKRFIAMLEAQWPHRPEGVDFRVVGNRHDFGTYYEVAIFFDDDDKTHVNFAVKVEAKLPLTWGEADA